ncbi:MAG: glycosyltransferase family 9 protein [Pseudomonadota bacterium]|nr:glycosyltransferase family 9 protein [Pseudomonadota bacterium]
MKILFITSNRIGDAVLSTGILGKLIELHPSADITVVCGPYAAELFYAVPNLEQLYVLRKKSWNRHWIKLWMVCIETPWDLIVDLRNSFTTRLLRANRRLYRTQSTGQHKVIENARVLGLEKTPPSPRLWLDEQAWANAAGFLPEVRPFITLGPAANWRAKQWPADRFAALAQKLTAPRGPFPNAPVLVIAAQAEQSYVEPVLAALGEQAKPVIGQELLAVAACLQESALFVGNDSGLMHMAAAMNTPTLGLFGPGLESIYGPWGPRSAFVRTPESRAELLKKQSGTPPGRPRPNLMDTLTVDAVFAAALDLLRKAESP